MTIYNPAEAERLIAEAREDGQRMTPAPWEWNADRNQLLGPYKEPPDVEIDDPGIRHCIIETDGGHYPPGAAVGTAIARQRNNLAAMADQLEAARAETERLRALWESTPLSVTAVAFANQNQRERILALESALREACGVIGNTSMFDEEMLARLQAVVDDKP